MPSLWLLLLLLLIFLLACGGGGGGGVGCVSLPCYFICITFAIVFMNLSSVVSSLLLPCLLFVGVDDGAVGGDIFLLVLVGCSIDRIGNAIVFTFSSSNGTDDFVGTLFLLVGDNIDGGGLDRFLDGGGGGGDGNGCASVN